MNVRPGSWTIALALLAAVAIASNTAGLLALVGCLSAVVFFSLSSRHLGQFSDRYAQIVSVILSVGSLAASLFLIWGGLRLTGSPNAWPLGFPFPDEAILVIHGLVNDLRISPFNNTRTLFAVGVCVGSLASLGGLAAGTVIRNRRTTELTSRPIQMWETYVLVALGAGVGIWMTLFFVVLLIGKGLSML